MKFAMKTCIVPVLLSLFLFAGVALAQKAPVAGITTDEVSVLAKGWSIKKAILDKDVFNEANEKVGTIEDLVVTPDKGISYAIVGAGGFLGMGKRDVAIPVNQFRIKDKRITLPGATKEVIKGMPEFKYVD